VDIPFGGLVEECFESVGVDVDLRRISCVYRGSNTTAAVIGT
jgi:hypothetical protein